MCGIAGIIHGIDGSGAPRGRVERRELAAMAAAIAHRGPDGEGFFLSEDGSVGLAHRRLAIVDIATGAQPLGNEDGAIQAVFNGEIYNHAELRRELEAAGHRFATRGSDTEVLVHGWEQWRDGLWARLRGMFAVALWDGRARELVLARDRAGKKPLFYTDSLPDGLHFASEIKALATHPKWSGDIDGHALAGYLSLQHVPPGLSIFEAVREVPPSTYLVWSQREGGWCRSARYWRPCFDEDPALRGITGEEAARLTLDRMDEAVRVRLEAEVPLGVFLSGGIDSAAVVALLRRHASGRLRTFSIGFEEERFNELPHARAVAERFATDHTEFVVRADAAEALPKVLWHADQPLADPALLPTWHLARLAREHVTVALNGDGGDEIFFGYPRYNGFAPVPWWPRIPEALRRTLAKALKGTTDPRLALAEYVNALSLMSPAHQYAEAMKHMRDDQVEALLDPRWQATVGRWTLTGMEGCPPPDAFLASDWATYLPGALLPKVDRMTMAAALEARSPLLDHRLAEFVWSLPKPIRGIVSQDRPPFVRPKSLMKRALRGLLPDDIIDRRKAGFVVPVGEWLRGPLRPLLRDALDTLGRRGWLRAEPMARLEREHASGTIDHKRPLWVLLCLELWARGAGVG
jgi:asparagine synthase (glutamine-hydrolysing)